MVLVLDLFPLGLSCFNRYLLYLKQARKQELPVEQETKLMEGDNSRVPNDRKESVVPMWIVASQHNNWWEG